MIDLQLPSQAYIDKFIPKNKFFEKAVVNTKLKSEFIDQIQKITWKYKIAESTTGTPKTENVEEIQVFEVQLRQRQLPKNILKLIDKAIPYPILYVLVYQDDIAYGISYKDENNYNYYFTEWNQEMNFDFHAINLEKVYQNIIAKFISPQEEAKQDFNSLVSKDNKIKSLQKNISLLESKIHKEKQFNKKVELNQQLQTKKKELAQLTI